MQLSTDFGDAMSFFVNFNPKVVAALIEEAAKSVATASN
jgi:hypothetical protein